MKSHEHARAESTNNKAISNGSIKNNQNQEAEEPKKKKRMKGIELADALMLPRQNGVTSKNGLLPPLPNSVEAQVWFMDVYMCVSMYVYVYLCVYVSVYSCIYVLCRVYVCAYVYGMHLCICVCMYVYLHALHGCYT